MEKQYEQPLEDDYLGHFLFEVFWKKKIDFPAKITKDTYAGIQYALSTLEKEEQEILYFRYIEKKNVSDVASYFSLTEEAVQTIERKAIAKLRLPGRWNYIRYGVAGYMRKRIAEEYKKGYHKGYCDGYRTSVEDTAKVEAEEKPTEEMLDLPIEMLGLSVRANNCLERAGLKRVRDVIGISSEKIRRIRNLGRRTAEEIAKTVRQYGFAHTAWNEYLP